jgi:23S rRNA (cytidine2498-2'-O)-methyltransferase
VEAAVVTIEKLGGTIYQAAKGFEVELAEELRGERIADRLFLAPGPPQDVAWAINTWIDPVRVRFESLGGASMALLSLGKKWAPFPVAFFDRTALIQKQLPVYSDPILRFPSPAPEPVGIWTLAGKKEILAASRTTRTAFEFVEDKEGPPSRAYLKLWEALTLLGDHPKKGETAVDLGSSPGGWTWVLQTLGARVISVDKAPLAPAIAKLPRIDFRNESAFGLDPKRIGHVDWIVSDVICYPEKIATLVLRWLDAHRAARWIVTIKFKGETDMASLAPLRKIPGSRLVHLHNNRHELTWMKK